MSGARLADQAEAGAVLALIRGAFAYMEGVIDPPSSLRHLTVQQVAQKCAAGQVLVLGLPAVAAVFVTPKAEALYIGKLAVDAKWRGQGLARELCLAAEGLARRQGLTWLELETRIELVANQAAFRALGFAELCRSRHAGFDRDTSITYRRKVAHP